MTAGCLSGEASFVICETAADNAASIPCPVSAGPVHSPGGERRCADIYSSPEPVCGHQTGDKRRTPGVRGQNRVRASAEVPLPGGGGKQGAAGVQRQQDAVWEINLWSCINTIRNTERE